MKAPSLFFAAIILYLAAFGTLSAEEGAPDDFGYVVFRDHCIACHLQSGHGIQAMGAPSIAGLPRLYVTDQLRKFRRNERGFSEEDAQGNLMQTNAYALDEKSIAFVGRYIETLDRNESRATLDQSTSENGALAYARACASCHGKSGEGDRSRRAPPLINQQDWYLNGQLAKFSSGQRHHYDSYKAQEASQSDLDAIVAWIANLP